MGGYAVRIGNKDDLCKHGYEPSTSIKKGMVDLIFSLLEYKAVLTGKFSLLYRACCFNRFFIEPTHAFHYTLKH